MLSLMDPPTYYSTFNEVDSTAVKALTAISNEMRNKYRVRLLIANVRGAVRDVFDKLKFTKVIGVKVGVCVCVVCAIL